MDMKMPSQFELKSCQAQCDSMPASMPKMQPDMSKMTMQQCVKMPECQATKMPGSE